MKRPAIVADTPEDARWRRLHDAALAGEALPPADAAFLRAHAPVGDAAREERRVLAELAALCEVDDADVDAALDAGDERRIAAAVDAALGRAPIDLDARRRRRAIAGGLALALAAAAAWAIVVRPLDDVPSDMIDRTGDRIAAATRDLAPAAESPADGPLRLLSGELAGPDAPALGEAIAAGPRPLRARGGACLGIAGVVRTCLEDQATIVVRGRAVELREGTARVEALRPAVSVAWTAVGAYAIVPEEAGAYTVIAAGARWELRAEAGALRIDGPGGASERIAAGEARVLAADAAEAATSSGGDTTGAAAADGAASASSDAMIDDATTGAATRAGDDAAASTDAAARTARPARRPAADPAALLREAQALRAAGDPAGAARAYRQVIAADPRGPLARASQVALGQLYLGPLGDPRAALRAFDAYLKGGAGAMSEEALYGKVSALDRLGRREAADAAAAELLRRFPASRYAAGLRGRGG